MQTHTSREIAEAMIARILPRSVPVTRTCDRCDGEGMALAEYPARYTAISPDLRHERCGDCDDGRESMMCEHPGHGVATTVLVDDKGREHFWCDACASDESYLDGADLAVCRMLKVLA